MKKLLLTLVCLLVTLGIKAQDGDHLCLNVVYIGNSITQGVILDNPRKEAPPVKASIYLRKQPKVGEIKYSNQGVSGNMTQDFLPEANTYFPKVKEAADIFHQEPWATLIFSIMLGTNDSAIRGEGLERITPEEYTGNMKKIMDELLTLYPGCMIVVHRPIWYSPSTYNSWKYHQEGLDRLNSYFPELKKLVTAYKTTHPLQVFLGDTKAYHYFKNSYEDLFFAEDGNSGVFYLHPNSKGAAKLGECWGEAIYEAIKKKGHVP